MKEITLHIHSKSNIRIDEANASKYEVVSQAAKKCTIYLKCIFNLQIMLQLVFINLTKVKVEKATISN